MRISMLSGRIRNILFLLLFLSGIVILPLAPSYFGLELVWLPVVLGFNKSCFLVGIVFLVFFSIKTYFAQLIFVLESIERQRIRPTPPPSGCGGLFLSRFCFSSSDSLF